MTRGGDDPIRYRVRVAAGSSSARAGITFDDSDGGPPIRKPQNNRETKSRMLVEFFQDDILVWSYTPCFKPCSIVPPPVAYNSFATQLVNFDPAREERIPMSVIRRSILRRGST